MSDDICDMVHVIYPKDFYVAPQQVLDWAHDVLCDAALADYVKANGPLNPDADGDLIHDAINRGTPRPTDLAEAMAILTDIGSHTFARV